MERDQPPAAGHTARPRRPRGQDGGAAEADRRAKVTGLPRQDGGELRGLIAVAAATDPKSAAEDIDKALAAVGGAGKRKDLDWPLLRLIEVGLAAGVATDKLEPAAATIDDP